MCIIIIIAHRLVFNQQRWKNYFRQKWLHCTKLTSYRKPTQSKSILKDPMVCLSVDGEKEMAGWVALCSILVWWEQRPVTSTHKTFSSGLLFPLRKWLQASFTSRLHKVGPFYFSTRPSVYMYLFYHRHYTLRLQFNEKDILKNIWWLEVRTRPRTQLKRLKSAVLSAVWWLFMRLLRWMDFSVYPSDDNSALLKLIHQNLVHLNQ